MIANPKHTAAIAEFKQKIAEYEVSIKAWESKKAEFENQKELYDKYQELVKANGHKADLVKKFSALDNLSQ